MRGQRRAVLVGDLVGLVQTATHDGGDLDAVDARERVEVFDAEGSGSSEGDAHVIPSTRRRYFDGFKIEVADRRVGRRHMVEAVELLHLLAERAAHDEPHDHLDTFGTRFAQVLDVRHLLQRVGVLRPTGRRTSWSNSELISPARGPWSWWLMPPVPQTWTLRSSS